MAVFDRDKRPAEARKRLHLRRRLSEIGHADINPIERVTRFFNETIWEERVEGSRYRRFFYPKIRVLALAFWNLQAHDAATRAAALTYTSLLALVPVLAVAFALFQVFGGLEGLEDKLRNLIVQYLAPGMEDRIKGWLESALVNIRSGARANAILATLLLFVTVIRTLTTLEATFNTIAGAKRGRAWTSRITVYWAVATLGPVFLGVSLAMTASVRDTSFVSWLDQHTPFVRWVYWIAPALLTCMAFVALYLFIPNTRIKVKPAIIGGLVAGLAFEIAKRAFTVGAAKLISSYNQVYGSIAILFVFFFWLYISWTILLVGLELVVAAQSATTHRKEELATKVSHKFKEMIALRLVTEICERFYSGTHPPTVEKLAMALDVPERLLYDVLLVLEAHSLVREVEEPGDEHGYIPARMLDRLTVQDVVTALREESEAELTVKEDDETRYLEDIVGRSEAASFAIYGAENMRIVVEHVIEWRRRGERPPAEEEPLADRPLGEAGRAGE